MSTASRELTGAVEKWRCWDLSKEVIKYLFVDGVIFSMRTGGKIENVPVLVAIGVREDGTKLVWRQGVGIKLAGILQRPEE